MSRSPEFSASNSAFNAFQYGALSCEPQTQFGKSTTESPPPEPAEGSELTMQPLTSAPTVSSTVSRGQSGDLRRRCRRVFAPAPVSQFVNRRLIGNTATQIKAWQSA